MASSTADCKRFIAAHPDVLAVGKGPWKRISKANASDGVERLFANDAQTCFVRVVEDTAGDLRVTHVTPTLSGLNAAAEALRGGKPRSAPSQPGNPEPAFRKDPDPQRQAAAKRVVASLVKREEYDEEDAENAGLALANAMIFAIDGYRDAAWNRVATVDETEMRTCSVVIVPEAFWRKHRCWSDWGLPIEHLVPYPEVSESPNETSAWEIGGFTDLKSTVRGLLDAGFRWSEDLQASLNQPNEPELDPEFLRWLRDGAPPEVPEPSQTSTPAAGAWVPPSLLTEAELMAALNRPHASMTYVILTPPGFERESATWERVQRLMESMSHGKQNKAPDAWTAFAVPEDSEAAQALEQAGMGPTGAWHVEGFLHRDGKPGRLTGDGIRALFVQNVEALMPPRLRRPKP